MSRPITWTRTTSWRCWGCSASLADAGSTVITTLHDPTLAARFADRVLLLHGDGRWTLGPVSTALTTQTLSELYLTPMLELGEHGRRVFVSAVRAPSTAACSAPLLASTLVVAERRRPRRRDR